MLLARVVGAIEAAGAVDRAALADASAALQLAIAAD